MTERPPDPFAPKTGAQAAARQAPAQPRTPQERYDAAQAAQAQAVVRAAAPPAAARPVEAGARKPFWRPISTAGLIAFLVGSAWLALLIKTDKDGFIQIIDSFNLVVHEFGHPIFGVFGEEPMFWGGTIAQLALPLILAGAFVYQRYALSALFCGVWFFENVFNVARYVADARAEELPLVSPGGGEVEHDWTHILGTLGQLQNDLAIASTLRTIGWIGIAICMLSGVLLWSRQSDAEDGAV
ncbi:MAG: hypothetical protein HZB14_04435 [Actinobacteria bacterium]|nr:hypothetical protein [Actinomycetota bacterium]